MTDPHSRLSAGPGSESGSIDYLSKDEVLTRSGGNQAWRHNNPGLLAGTLAARKAGALAVVYGKAVFPDRESGEQALARELEHPKYRGKTLAQLIGHFIPDYVAEPPAWDEANNASVLPWIESFSGLDMHQPVPEPAVFIALVCKHTGWQEGRETRTPRRADSDAPKCETVANDNVLINGRTAVHGDSGGVLSTVDVCLTPIGKKSVPIAYANTALSEDASATADSILINEHPACHLGSIFSKSSGDEAGTDKGIKSGSIQGKAEFLQGSHNVYFEGQPAVREGDLMVSNNRNTSPVPLSQPGGEMPTLPEFDAPTEVDTGGGAKRFVVKISGAQPLDGEWLAKG